MPKTLWVDKYRPSTLDEYVWKDKNMRTKVEEWLQEKSLPNLLFVGTQGAGKTSLAFLLLKLLKIPDSDILYINASKERKIDEVQDRLSNFVNTWALGETGIKYVIFDELDGMVISASKMVRAEIERYSDITRFIATANYKEKIIPALISRFQVINFQALDQEQFMTRICEILVNENVEIDPDVIETYVKASYPDLRKAINNIEQNTVNGKLIPPDNNDNTQDYILNMVSLFKERKYIEARKLIISQAQPEEYPNILRKLYQNLDWFGVTQEQQDKALLIIRDAVCNLALAGDPEIILAACLAELTLNTDMGI